MSKVRRWAAGLLLGGAILAACGGCGGADNKPLERLSEKDAAKRADEMFKQHMGQMRGGAGGPGGAPAPGTTAPSFPGSPGGPSLPGRGK